jgi:hypothetical protein
MITKLTKHDSHTVRIHLTKVGSKHYAALRCVDCNTHIQWLSAFESSQLKSMDIEVVQPQSYKAIDVEDLF